MKKTMVFLNEWSCLVLEIWENELHDKIIKWHDKDWNFINVFCKTCETSQNELVNIWKRIKLYTKRILFFYEL